MKKLLSILLCMLFGGAIFLTGCGGLPIVENKDKGIIFNGGAVSLVGDHLFFANGFTKDYSSMADMDAYNKASKYSNLNRIKLDNLDSATTYTSSEKVEGVSKNDVVGFGKTYTFAYGDFVYYVCPNTHKTNENKQAFDYLSVFKIKNDGSSRKELMTTKQAFDSTNGKIVALEYDDVAYLMIYDGANFTVFDITNGDSKKLDMEKVTSIALPQEDADWNGKFYYTKDKENSDGMTGNDVFVTNLAGEEKKITKNGSFAKTIKFIDRIDDTNFFTISDQGATTAPTYTIESEQITTEDFSTAYKAFYPKEVSAVFEVDGKDAYKDIDGYVFTSNNVVLYKNTVKGGDPTPLFDNTTYSSAKVISVVGAYAYFATSTAVYKVMISSGEVTTLVEEMTITTDVFGYTFNVADGEKLGVKDVYFYAQRMYDEEAEKEETTEEEAEEKDENIYLYQVSANGGKAKLDGKTTK